MADEQDKNDERLEISNDDAEKLLADTVEGETSTDDTPADRDEPKDDKDWAAEAERWKRLSRKNEKDFKAAAARLKEFEDANKTESERLLEERDSHKTRAEKAEVALKRREIAEEVAPEHATLAQIKAVAKRLAGDSEEDLEADARELFALLAPEPNRAASKMPAPPKERLRGGSEPDDDPEPTDPRKLAALIPRRR